MPIARSNCSEPCGARSPAAEQPLPVVGQLHVRASDLDSRARARRLLILGLLQHGFGECCIRLGGFHVGIRLHRRQVRPRHWRRHLSPR